MAGKKKLTSAREVALQVLLDCRKIGAWSDSALSSAIRSAELNARDAGLASRLCYGVQQNQYLLDYYLEQLCSVALKKLEPAVLVAMELGLYQMNCLDRIPVRAAVDQSVELARRWSKNPRSPGLVNAVLRSYDRQKGTLPQPKELWIRHSHPKWLVELFDRELKGKGVEALLEANNSQPATVVQANTLKTTAEELKA
ncbi:MAG: 16S rRNA (cytosine(967)-C(5))-methyltransferase RsmB, partial [Oscillospiraceae bacterium]|nr:16S rRNA (cytosine(967)-C(5))-methyltransferase RsmB [Oscillospiraceae bacterium]